MAELFRFCCRCACLAEPGIVRWTVGIRRWHAFSLFDCSRRRMTEHRVWKIVTPQQNIKAPAVHDWIALFWLRLSSFSGLVPSNHCSQRTKACATWVWQNGSTNDATFTVKQATKPKQGNPVMSFTWW